MTVWSRQEVARFLATAGMPANRINEFVAIAVCESSLNDQAVSPADAVGLWQVIPSTAAGVGFSRAQMFIPQLNAIAAVRISGHGANCAAWDTCYDDIQASGRFSFLSFPQSRSCAATHIVGVSVATGTSNTGGGAAPPFPGVTGTLAHTVMIMDDLAVRGLPPHAASITKWAKVAAISY